MTNFRVMGGYRSKSLPSVAVAVGLTVAAITLWGFSHRLYATLLPGLGPALALTTAQTNMARSGIALGYLLMCLPTAFISRNLGYKIGMLFGLGTFAIGMFLVYPAVEQHSVAFFLISATVVGSGLAILEVTAIPLIVFLGRRQTACQRMVLAEGLSPLSAVLALTIGPKILASASATPHNLVLLLSTVGVAAIVLAFIMEMVPFPPVATARTTPGESTLASFHPPLRIKRFRYAVAATFLCLFAQIVIAGSAPQFSSSAMPSLSSDAAQLVLIGCYSAFGIGRFVGPLVMRWIAPLRLTVMFAVASAICCAVSAVISGPGAIASVLAAAFFMAILFPTIFADALLDLGEMAKSATAILMFVAFTGTGAFALLTAVLTPAILPSIMVLPALCFAGVAAFAVALQRSRCEESAAPE